MSEPFVNVEDQGGGITLLTMNRPENYNALNASMTTALKDAVARVETDRDCRVAILTGAGRGFCAGADLSGTPDPAPDTEGRGRVATVYRSQEHLAQLMLAIRECPKPIIGAIHGAAVGGGFAIALACDVRVATEGARFGSVFIRVGLSSCDVGTSYLLPRLVGAGRAAELMLTGRHFDAEEAYRIGLLHAVTAEGEAVAKAMETAGLIAANNEYGVWMTKVGLAANLDAPSMRHAIELENRTQVLGTFTDNMTEAAAAFREKRTPEWRPM
jgi:enoyl-CoA hydratase